MHKLLSPLPALLLLAAFGACAADKPLEVRYGLSEVEFRAANDTLFAQGLRLADITVVEAKGKPVIGAIWQRLPEEPAGTPERIKQLQDLVFLKQDRAQVEATANRLGPAGSRIEVVDAYSVGDKTFYATVYSPPKEDPMATVGLFLTAAQADAMREEALANSFELLRLDVVEGDEVLLFPSFVYRPDADVESIQGDTSLQYLAERVKMELMGRAPLSITMYRQANGYPGFMGLFDDEIDARDLVLDKPQAEFRSTIDPIVAEGGLVIDIDSFERKGEVSYSAVYMRKH